MPLPRRIEPRYASHRPTERCDSALRAMMHPRHHLNAPQPENSERYFVCRQHPTVTFSTGADGCAARRMPVRASTGFRREIAFLRTDVITVRGRGPRRPLPLTLPISAPAHRRGGLSDVVQMGLPAWVWECLLNTPHVERGALVAVATETMAWRLIHFRRSSSMAANCSSAACRSSTISAAMTAGSGRLAESSSESSLSQKISRFTLSRFMSSS